MRAGRAGFVDVPWVSSRARLSLSALSVENELAVRGVADATLERTKRFRLRLALGDLAIEEARPSLSRWRIWATAAMWMA